MSRKRKFHEDYEEAMSPPSAQETSGTGPVEGRATPASSAPLSGPMSSAQSSAPLSGPLSPVTPTPLEASTQDLWEDEEWDGEEEPEPKSPPSRSRARSTEEDEPASPLRQSPGRINEDAEPASPLRLSRARFKAARGRFKADRQPRTSTPAPGSTLHELGSPDASQAPSEVPRSETSSQSARSTSQESTGSSRPGQPAPPPPAAAKGTGGGQDASSDGEEDAWADLGFVTEQLDKLGTAADMRQYFQQRFGVDVSVGQEVTLEGRLKGTVLAWKHVLSRFAVRVLITSVQPVTYRAGKTRKANPERLVCLLCTKKASGNDFHMLRTISSANNGALIKHYEAVHQDFLREEALERTLGAGRKRRAEDRAMKAAARAKIHGKPQHTLRKFFQPGKARQNLPSGACTSRRKNALRDAWSLVVADGLPANFLERPSFLNAIRVTAEDAPPLMPSRRGAQARINTLAAEQGSSVDGDVKAADAIILAVDAWGRPGGASFLGATVSYWRGLEIADRVLAFEPLHGHVTGRHLADVIADILAQHEIPVWKVAAILTDACSTNRAALRMLAEEAVAARDEMADLAESEEDVVQAWQHIADLRYDEAVQLLSLTNFYCLCHQIQLLAAASEAKDGDASRVMAEVDAVTRWIRTSNRLMAQLVKMGGTMPPSKNPTRFLGNQEQLEAVLKGKTVLIQLMEQEGRREELEVDWDLAEKYCALLRPYHKLTVLLQAGTFPSGNLAFLGLWTLQRNTEKMNRELGDGLLSQWTGQAMKEFERRFSRFYPKPRARAQAADKRLLAQASLDPGLWVFLRDQRYLAHGQDCLREIFTLHECTALRAVGYEAGEDTGAEFPELEKQESMVQDGYGMEFLLEEEGAGTHRPNAQQSARSRVKAKNEKLLQKYQDQVQAYLSEMGRAAALSPASQKDVRRRPQLWWHSAERYNLIRPVALRVLLPPASSAAAERLFSKATRLSTKLMRRLSPQSLCNRLIVSANSAEGSEALCTSLRHNDVQAKLSTPHSSEAAQPTHTGDDDSPTEAVTINID